MTKLLRQTEGHAKNEVTESDREHCTSENWFVNLIEHKASPGRPSKIDSEKDGQNNMVTGNKLST